MTNESKTVSLSLTEIKVDPACQARAGTDESITNEYAEVMKEKGYDRFPAVVVFCDGSDYWLSDGFHRHAAAEKAGLPSLNARIRQGTRRDASSMLSVPTPVMDCGEPMPTSIVLSPCFLKTMSGAVGAMGI